ncbi:MAG: S41 family peptidase [Gammaproteobacteria bacterium]|nr:S41 family peptidase [Gammaproteobacteria bacterium]
MKALSLTALICALWLAAPVSAETTTPAQLIDALTQKLHQGYVYPDKVANIEKALRQHGKTYAGINDPEKLAEALTAELQQASGDMHLRVSYSPDPIPETTGAQAGEIQAMEREMWRAHNFGVSKLERMSFNIGYFKLDAFPPVADAGGMFAASMTVLANTDSLIIDLRENFGGDHSVSLLSSYFLDQRTHLLDMHWREAKGPRVEPDWTTDTVAGVKYGEAKDVYILTSKETFSAAEAFSYGLKNLKRATVVGETTGGAAHAGDDVRIAEHFALFLPNGRPVSPVTKGNWEGVGVMPDIRVPAEHALAAAQKAILEKLLKAEKNPERVTRIKARLAELDSGKAG